MDFLFLCELFVFVSWLIILKADSSQGMHWKCPQIIYQNNIDLGRKLSTRKEISLNQTSNTKSYLPRNTLRKVIDYLHDQFYRLKQFRIINTQIKLFIIKFMSKLPSIRKTTTLNNPFITNLARNCKWQ